HVASVNTRSIPRSTRVRDSVRNLVPRRARIDPDGIPGLGAVAEHFIRRAPTFRYGHECVSGGRDSTDIEAHATHVLYEAVGWILTVNQARIVRAQLIQDASIRDKLTYLPDVMQLPVLRHELRLRSVRV